MSTFYSTGRSFFVCSSPGALKFGIIILSHWALPPPVPGAAVLDEKRGCSVCRTKRGGISWRRFAATWHRPWALGDRFFTSCSSRAGREIDTRVLCAQSTLRFFVKFCWAIDSKAPEKQGNDVHDMEMFESRLSPAERTELQLEVAHNNTCESEGTSTMN